MKILDVTASCSRCKQVIDINSIGEVCPYCKVDFDQFDPTKAKEILTKELENILPRNYFIPNLDDSSIFFIFTEFGFVVHLVAKLPVLL